MSLLLALWTLCSACTSEKNDMGADGGTLAFLTVEGLEVDGLSLLFDSPSSLPCSDLPVEVEERPVPISDGAASDVASFDGMKRNPDCCGC
mmetsp:Transcript_85931/g.221214  ORF Transcript_85931/g.221214 Transcript_85931/m.221214 type:complete len:91 (-) Transcript_85931:70-342(-)